MVSTNVVDVSGSESEGEISEYVSNAPSEAINEWEVQAYGNILNAVETENPTGADNKTLLRRRYFAGLDGKPKLSKIRGNLQ